jgi:hypothetical protein
MLRLTSCNGDEGHRCEGHPKSDCRVSYAESIAGSLRRFWACLVHLSESASARTAGIQRDAKKPRSQNVRFGPVAPHPPADNPEESIESMQLGARPLAFVNRKLLAECYRLHCQTMACN